MRRRHVITAALLAAVVLALGVSAYATVATIWPGSPPSHAATHTSTVSTTAPRRPSGPVFYYHVTRSAALRFGPRARPVTGVVIRAGTTVKRWGPAPSRQWINVTIAAMNGYLPAADLAPIYATEKVK